MSVQEHVKLIIEEDNDVDHDDIEATYHDDINQGPQYWNQYPCW